MELRKSLHFGLTKKDKELAKQNIEEKELPLFFKQFSTFRKLPPIDWFFMIVTCLVFFIDMIYFSDYIFTQSKSTMLVKKYLLQKKKK